MSARERLEQLQPPVVAWFNPENPNSVINAAQYPHVLDKNKVGYVPCIVEPLGGWVHILTYEVGDFITGEWRKCRAVYASHASAKKFVDGWGPNGIRNVSIVGSLLHA